MVFVEHGRELYIQTYICTYIAESSIRYSLLPPCVHMVDTLATSVLYDVFLFVPFHDAAEASVRR